MNKKGFLKALMLGFVVAIAVVFLAGNVMAQVISTQVMLTDGAVASLDAMGERIADGATPDPNNPVTALLDNFEYWNNPRNMGWTVVEPPYPVWGAGLGFGQVNNVLDFEQGSRVLDVYRPMSVFLMNTPYDVFQIYKPCVLRTGHKIPGANSAMSLEVRAPLAIEAFDSFAVIVVVTVSASDGDTETLTIVFQPSEGPMGATGLVNPLDKDVAIDGDDQNMAVVYMGRQFQDGTWHLVMEDLAQIVAQYDRGSDDDVHDPPSGSNATIKTIDMVMIRGNQYRVDNICFTLNESSLDGNGTPHLFRIGPVYCQLYGQQGLNPQGRWLLAEDRDLGCNATYNRDGELVLTNITDSRAPGADPDPDPVTIDEDGEINTGYDPDFLVICDLDPNGMPDLSEQHGTNGLPTLDWLLTMGDTLGPEITDGFLEPASFDGADSDIGDAKVFTKAAINSWPPYLVQEDGMLVQNKMDPNVADSGALYLQNQSNPVYLIACALVNGGYDTFPQALRIVPHLGQVFEDMIVTCRVSDRIMTDKETFPISVVNYPVTNNPPVINDVYDQVFYVGMQNGYRIVALDPDIQDMSGLTYHATLNGLSNYQYGPWMNNIINPQSGVISFTPQFEAALDCIVTVQDPRGMMAVAELTIFCINGGTWLNHPPIILDDLESPQTVRAGERFIANEMRFVDPDGDKMYWSCNIGSVGNNGVYSFQSQFPGYYLVQITAYDIRGGAATTEFVIHVRPWWSM